jgi:hypothetical protein
MTIRYILALVLTVLLLAFARRMSTRHQQEFTSSVDGITLSHNTVTESFGENPVVMVKATSTENIRGTVYYSKQVGGPDYNTVDMVPTTDGLTASLNPLPKGEKYFYHIEVFKGNTKLAAIPPKGDQFIKFKGHISPIILIPHIGFMFATIFFGLLAVFTSVDIARGKGDIKRSVLFVLLTFIPAFIGGIPLGIAVSAQTFGGSGWGGWPLGSDITDTKTEILLLFWLITIILSWKGLSGRKMTISNGFYSFLVILSFVVTFITFLIPHSI